MDDPRVSVLTQPKVCGKRYSPDIIVMVLSSKYFLRDAVELCIEFTGDQLEDLTNKGKSLIGDFRSLTLIFTFSASVLSVELTDQGYIPLIYSLKME